jgi:CHASE2 domain-containing sensor protein/tRNA A-37 threonylcarbamoyl transferase component Bud32
MPETLVTPDALEIVDAKYRLERRLGEGATGVVYLATHLALHKQFALKLLRLQHAADPASFQRFRREAEALGRLKHPHIVEVTDFGIDNGAGFDRPYLVMEYLDGITLADHCAERGGLPVEEVLPLLEAIASAVDHAHDAGILHRDLKPGNVLLCRTPAGLLPKVVDFGLAGLKAEGEAPASPNPSPEPEPVLPAADTPSDLTGTGALLGTPRYIAPELIRAPQASRASDIYSFGVMAYEVLVGRPPFDGSATEVLMAHLNEAPPPPTRFRSALPPEIEAPLLAPVHKDPTLRPATAHAVVSGLGRAWRDAQRRRWRATELPRRTGLALALALVALGAALGLEGTGPVQEIDRSLADRRVVFAASRAADPRVLLVMTDEGSLAADSRPFADRADEFGTVLQRVYAAGARAVAIDFLLPRSWSRSRPFSELVLRHPDTLTLGAMATPNGKMVGTECVFGITTTALGPEATSSLFGLVNVEQDEDGVVRHARLFYREQSGARRLSWAARATAVAGVAAASGHRPDFLMDPTLDWRRFERLSWTQIPSALDEHPEIFRGRIVLVGGDFLLSGDDSHRIVGRDGRPEAVSGLALQALTVDTILAGLPVRESRGTPFLLALAAAWAAATCVLSLRRPQRVIALATAGALAYAAAALLWFAWTLLVMPVAGPLLTVGCAVLFSSMVRSGLPSIPD